MNRKLTAALLIAAAVLDQRRLHRRSARVQLPRRPQGAGRRDPRRVPGVAGHRHLLVRGDGALRRPVRPDRHRRRAALRRPGDARRGAGRHRRRGGPGDRPVPLAAAGPRVRRRRRQRRPGASPARPATPSTPRTRSSAPSSARPSATSSPPPGRCSSCVALGRALAGRWFTVLGGGLGGARSSPASCPRWTSRSSTPPTSPATSCGASG